MDTVLLLGVLKSISTIDYLFRRASVFIVHVRWAATLYLVGGISYFLRRTTFNESRLSHVAAFAGHRLGLEAGFVQFLWFH